jgi:hypothetical protein
LISLSDERGLRPFAADPFDPAFQIVPFVPGSLPPPARRVNIALLFQ